MSSVTMWTIDRRMRNEETRWIPVLQITATEYALLWQIALVSQTPVEDVRVRMVRQEKI